MTRRSALGERPLHSTARTPRLRRCPALLLLALVMGSAGQIPAARAASPSRDGQIGIWLVAEQVGARRTLCVGDEVQIRLAVYKAVQVDGRVLSSRLAGINVEASMVGRTGIGSARPGTSVTRVSGTPPGTTYFAFKAENPGTVSVLFKARVNQLSFLGLEAGGQSLRTDITFTVEDCKYRVTVTSRWQVPGEANIAIVARIHIAGMVEVGPGQYRGQARVQWYVSLSQVGDCSGALPPESQGQVDGTLLDPEHMLIDVTYETAIVTLAVDCRGAGGPRPVQLTPDTVSFVIPPFGGNRTQAHVLSGPEQMIGTVTARVQRITSR
jgi:hypothetical protein